MSASIGRVALGLAALLPALAGCAAVRRPPATPATLAADASVARADYRATVDTIVERLARRAQRRGDRTLDVLLLSGGGQNGAYGVGFLRGWRERAGDRMPRFDLVTGVSTGALQAPFALLGTEAALDTVTALYRDADERIAPGLNWLFWLRRTGGVVKPDKLRRTIAEVLDERMQRALRAEFDDGRQLAVATTDMDLGVGRVWNFGEALDSTPAGLAHARSLLLASSAIPAIFPPVLLDGHVHNDGGIIANLLPVLDDVNDYEALERRLRAAGVTEPVTVRIWAILNEWTHQPPVVLNPADRRAIARRSNGLLFWTQQTTLAAQLATLAAAVNGSVSGVRLEVRATAVPASLASEPGANKLFDGAFMRRLEEFGYTRAQSAEAWGVPGSPYERPEKDE